MARDYYDVLGVARGASTEEITKAYKKLARQNHPDRNLGDAQAEGRFKEIQNAYDTLSDPTKRAQYDQYGSEGPIPGFGPGGFGGAPGGFGFGGGGGPGGQTIDPEVAQEMFRRMFGGGGGPGAGGFNPEDIFGGGGRSRGGRSRRAAPENLDVEAQVPFLTAANGGIIKLRVGSQEIDVKVPAGFEDGKKLRVAGQGPNGADIMVKVKIEPHPHFRRDGKDILLDVPISLQEALLGGKVEVPTVAGKRVDVKIKPGTSSGTKTRIPGFGVSGGDQILIFKVLVPKTLDDRSKQLIEEFAKLNPLDARADINWK